MSVYFDAVGTAAGMWFDRADVEKSDHPVESVCGRHAVAEHGTELICDEMSWVANCGYDPVRACCVAETIVVWGSYAGVYPTSGSLGEMDVTSSE